MAISPRSSRWNRYNELFTAVFAGAGYQVRPLQWLRPAPIQILHWPHEFFRTGGAKVWTKLLLMWLSRRLFGARWIWVVHDMKPHDLTAAGPAASPFIRQLDGLVFLSSASANEFASLYRSAAPRLVTRHGDYRTGALTPSRPWRPPDGAPRLQYLGLIRPYKNLDELIEAAKPLGADLTLCISGRAAGTNAASLAKAGTGHAHISIDARPEILPEAELEVMVDVSDAVIAPYRRITNSGAAIFALSRNRPVIGPALGSLVELREEIGPDWIYLYDGPLTAEVLRKACAWVRETPRSPTSPMDNYTWGRIGPEILRFVEEL